MTSVRIQQFLSVINYVSKTWLERLLTRGLQLYNSTYVYLSYSKARNKKFYLLYFGTCYWNTESVNFFRFVFLSFSYIKCIFKYWILIIHMSFIDRKNECDSIRINNVTSGYNCCVVCLLISYVNQKANNEDILNKVVKPFPETILHKIRVSEITHLFIWKRNTF